MGVQPGEHHRLVGQCWHGEVVVEETSTLPVFVDQSSIEVFMKDGEDVLTSLIFSNANSVGLQISSLNGGTRLRSLNAWKLSSIWN